MIVFSRALAAFCSAEWNHLCNFDREYYEEQWFRRMCHLKDFLSRALHGRPPVWWSRTIYAILEEGIVGNIHVKLFEIRTSGSGDVV